MVVSFLQQLAKRNPCVPHTRARYAARDRSARPSRSCAVGTTSYERKVTKKTGLADRLLITVLQRSEERVLTFCLTLAPYTSVTGNGIRSGRWRVLTRMWPLTPVALSAEPGQTDKDVRLESKQFGLTVMTGNFPCLSLTFIKEL